MCRNVIEFCVGPSGTRRASERNELLRSAKIVEDVYDKYTFTES